MENRSWYNANTARSWPLHAGAAWDDAGALLPNNLLADLHLRFPADVAAAAQLSAITVGPRVVTATFVGLDETRMAITGPLAVVSLRRPVTSGRQYPLEGLVAGVGGWIVFGNGLDEPGGFAGRFSTAGQAVLAPFAARPYRRPAVSSLGKLGAGQGLTGLVTLAVGNDLQISYEEVHLHGGVRNAIVIQLKSNSPGDPRNVFDLYRGPCGARPESRTCGDPPPIERLGGVEPDCDGNLTLEFTGGESVAAVTQEATLDGEGHVSDVATGCHGAVLDFPLGLSDACPQRLPDADGTLPGEKDGLCA